MRIQPVCLDLLYLFSKKRGAHFNLDAKQTKKYYFFYFDLIRGWGGGVCQKHVNLFLGRSHNSFDTFN